MKKLIALFIGFISISVNAQESKYELTMERIIAFTDSAKTVESIQNSCNTFERIAVANPKEWLPVYYQSYCHVMIGMRQNENSKKDEYFDRAEKLINAADSISPDNSEIYVMKAWIMSMKISVDPANRGQKYGRQSSIFYSRAIELDKENPRAYLLQGTGLLYTPEQFGGGKEKAIPVLETAVAKFKTFKPSNRIMPHWGEQRAIQVLEQCKNSTENGK